MDEAYRQHASPSRHKNRSSANLNHLSLAPMTSRLPLSGGEGPEAATTTQYISTSRSYIEGKSVPTTPRLLARNHPRTPIHPSAVAAASLPKKSLSATALHSMGAVGTGGATTPRQRRHASGTQTPTRHHHHRLTMTAAELQGVGTDRDWLEHTGALLSDSAREYKGQSWLVSRDSSTSLTGQGQQPHGALQLQFSGLDEAESRRSSGSNSRGGSRGGSRAVTPLESGNTNTESGYFGSGINPMSGSDKGVAVDDEWASGPDFVNLDEGLEASGPSRASMEADEAAIRTLVRTGNSGLGGWIGSVVGWRLFSVDEGDEVAAEEDEDEKEGWEDARSRSRGDGTAHRVGGDVGVTITPREPIPPPNQEDNGTWQDAAWLLSVASKVFA